MESTVIRLEGWDGGILAGKTVPGKETKVEDYFLGSSFFRYLAGFLSKSLRQGLQHSLIS